MARHKIVSTSGVISLEVCRGCVYTHAWILDKQEAAHERGMHESNRIPK